MKFPDSLIKEVREKYYGEVSQATLSEEYGISRAYISEIVRGLKRPNAPGPISKKALCLDNSRPGMSRCSRCEKWKSERVSFYPSDKGSRWCKRCHHIHTVERKFGLKAGQYGEMYREQKGLCWGCRHPETNGKRLAVDHDHLSGVVRHLLCQRCNLLEGLLGILYQKVGKKGVTRFIEDYSTFWDDTLRDNATEQETTPAGADTA